MVSLVSPTWQPPPPGFHYPYSPQTVYASIRQGRQPPDPSTTLIFDAQGRDRTIPTSPAAILHATERHLPDLLSQESFLRNCS